MSVHLVFNLTGLGHCQQRRQADEPIVLLGDGVYGASTAISNCFVLEQDAIARGVAPNLRAVQFIDYDAFVTLTVKHHPSVSWVD